MVNKVACLSKAYMLLVSDTGFHGGLIHCEGSERQNVSSKGRKEQNEKSGQMRVEGDSAGKRTGKTAGESTPSCGASMMDRRLSASHLPSPFVQNEILFLRTCPLEKATPAQK